MTTEFENYMSTMRQDYPKDFAEENEFLSALLDTCEITDKEKEL
jgi:hypothetical protein